VQLLGPDEYAPPVGGSAVTIGAYDGVHRGHQALLGELGAMAAERGLVPTVVTFDRHPATVVRPESAPLLLTDLPQKLELLAECGVERTVVVPFDRERANETAEDFVTEVLVGALGARLVVVGADFHFGHGRKGNVTLLTELGRDLGFEVDGVVLAGDGPEPVSSTRIRRLVADGAVAEAAELLGRPHQVRGPVVRGDGRGRAELGIPTANVDVPSDIALPGLGIYAGYYTRPDGTVHPAAISVGRRPTFYEAADTLLEAHLIDFGGDLYGEVARVGFVDRLRAEERFASTGALRTQMERDLDAARRRLSPCAIGPPSRRRPGRRGSADVRRGAPGRRPVPAASLESWSGGFPAVWRLC
jgi:riboflavin kinase / FMN adenylyltransferase